MNTDSLDLIKDAHNRKIVELIYRATLGRDPDVTGLAHYCKVLEDGGSIGGIIKVFQESDEYEHANTLFSRFVQMTHTDEVHGMGPHAKRIYLALQSELSKKEDH